MRAGLSGWLQSSSPLMPPLYAVWNQSPGTANWVIRAVLCGPSRPRQPQSKYFVQVRKANLPRFRFWYEVWCYQPYIQEFLWGSQIQATAKLSLHQDPISLSPTRTLNWWKATHASLHHCTLRTTCHCKNWGAHLSTLLGVSADPLSAPVTATAGAV